MLFQFIHRSHKVGRIDHVRIGEQVGADLARLQDIRTVLPSLHCELGPGDAVFFHCNLLHCSAQNNSDRRRWAYLMCYNTKQNNPVRPHHLPQYTPLNKVSNLLQHSIVRISAYLMCYNTIQNNSVRPHRLPQYTPLNKVSNLLQHSMVKISACLMCYNTIQNNPVRRLSIHHLTR